jgi:phosphotransferase system  glucose/maltose/N-acetylglucosamine-specific IIC component
LPSEFHFRAVQTFWRDIFARDLDFIVCKDLYRARENSDAEAVTVSKFPPLFGLIVFVIFVFATQREDQKRRERSQKEKKKILTTLPYILIYINAGGHVTA